MQRVDLPQVGVVFTRGKRQWGENARYDDGYCFVRKEKRGEKPDSKCWVDIPAFARHDGGLMELGSAER